MKASKLMLAMVCCAMSGVAMGQGEKPKTPEKKVIPTAQPTGDKKSMPAAQPAGDHKDAKPAMSPEMAMMEAGTPGEMHKWIAKNAGTWDATVKMMMPGQPPSESKATMTSEMIFGGRYMHSMFKGDFMGMPFEGVATLGYNNTSGKFEGTWADSMSTATFFTTGTLDKAGKVLTLKGECLDPETKKTYTQRNVSTIKNDNEMVDEFYKIEDGKETKMMEITYVRAKGAAKEKSAAEKMKDEAEKMKKKAEDAIKGAMPGEKK